MFREVDHSVFSSFIDFCDVLTRYDANANVLWRHPYGVSRTIPYESAMSAVLVNLVLSKSFKMKAWTTGMKIKVSPNAFLCFLARIVGNIGHLDDKGQQNLY